MAYKEIVIRVARMMSRAGLPHAFVGALAAGYHGLARSTRDIDVMVVANRAEIKELTRLVVAAGFRKIEQPFGTMETGKLVVESDEGYRVEFLLVRTEHEVELVKRGMKAHIFGVNVWIASPEDLVLQKLAIGGAKDIVDAAAVLMRQKGILDVRRMESWASKLGVKNKLKELMKKVK
ncbi:MAG: hypothetical protein AB1476_03455 [Candidatus Hadarchaeota archaeon]